MALRYYPQPNRCRRCSQRSVLSRSGAAAVEMAAVLPLFILLVFGIIEFGRALMVHQMLVNSAREAARYAVVPNATDTELTNKVDSYLSSAGITGYTTEVRISRGGVDQGVVWTKVDGSAAVGSFAPQPDDEITITASVPYTNVTLGFAYLIASNRTFSASVVMRKE